MIEVGKGKVPVVYHIKFNKDKGLFDLTLFSSYPEEKEILIQDGLKYSVIEKRY